MGISDHGTTYTYTESRKETQNRYALVGGRAAEQKGVRDILTASDDTLLIHQVAQP